MSNNRQHSGHLFVMSAPAGTGKTTLITKLKEEFSYVVQSIAYTSRKPRPNEVDGVDYHFVSKEEFEKKIREGAFLEYVTLYNDYYGTDKKWVEEQLDEGKSVFLVIDTQGAMKLRGNVEAIFIFIMPPSFEELEARIRQRKTETTAKIEKRLSWAKKEIENAENYDFLIVNDDLEIAYQELKTILVSNQK